MQVELDFDDRWVDELFEWAAYYDIPDLRYAEPEYDDDGHLLFAGYWYGLPRTKSALLTLEELNLDGFIKSDIPDQIRHLTTLKKLSLSRGPKAYWSVEDVDRDIDVITEIPPWIDQLANLEELDLSDNSISYVPRSISKLAKLKKLYLNCNRIEYVTDNLAQLVQLETLWLGFNETALLTEAIRSIPNLKEIWFDGLPGCRYGPIRIQENGINICTHTGEAYVPLGQYEHRNIFSALEAFEAEARAPWIPSLFEWADQNNIPNLQLVESHGISEEGNLWWDRYWVGLPRDPYVLLALEELDLSWHNCEEMPEQLRHLKNLKTLRFAKRRDGLQPDFYENSNGPNAIEKIPAWISELESLEELNLSRNNILAVPDSIGSLKNLRKLYLDNNRIVFISPELRSLVNLEVLWIQKNAFFALDIVLDKLKRSAHFDVGWDQLNKLSLLKECVGLLESLNLSDEWYADFDLWQMPVLIDAISELSAVLGTRDAAELWREWQHLSDLKGIVKDLHQLKEIWCDQIKLSRLGPIEAHQDGILVYSEEERVLLKPESKSVFAVHSEDVFPMGLYEKLEALNLWTETPIPNDSVPFKHY